jgi:serine/threonine protein kinase HipA of HipAB toxin-antitoxin module
MQGAPTNAKDLEPTDQSIALAKKQTIGNWQNKPTVSKATINPTLMQINAPLESYLVALASELINTSKVHMHCHPTLVDVRKWSIRPFLAGIRPTLR